MAHFSQGERKGGGIGAVEQEDVVADRAGRKLGESAGVDQPSQEGRIF
jgi:hypothetical protein